MASRPAVTQPIGKTGSAPIDRQGHTTSGHFGSNPSAQARTGRSVRDLNVK